MSERRWRVAAASVRGAAHEKSGLPCQDAHKWLTVPGGVLAVAVADGAGSAPLAQVGATLAVESALASVAERLRDFRGGARSDDASLEETLKRAAAEARNTVETEANKQSVPIHHLATTLMVVVAVSDCVAALQIGDGAVIAAGTDGTINCVTRPPAGEYLNETTFLTSTEALCAASAVLWHGSLAHLALLSDGLQMAALRMPAAEPHAGFFQPLFDFLQQEKDTETAQSALAGFLASPRLRQRSDDDVTLVLATLIS